MARLQGSGQGHPSRSASKLDDDDDDELSELESEPEEADETVEVAGELGEDDAEGERMIWTPRERTSEVVDEDAEGEELDSDDETPGAGSGGETPDLSRMTARQRAKHGDVQEYMKLSDGRCKVATSGAATRPCHCANTRSRGPSKEGLHGGGTRNEACRDGPPETQA